MLEIDHQVQQLVFVDASSLDEQIRDEHKKQGKTTLVYCSLIA
jgi:hypothetical protein